MAVQLPTPTKMTTKGNIDANWRNFKEEYEEYIIATEQSTKDKEIQASTLKYVMGAECRKILKGLKLTEDKLKDPKEILEALDAKFLLKRNILFERHLFYSAVQQPNEPVEQYIDRLRELVSTCDFGDTEEDMLRDRIVLGCSDQKAKARLFRQKETCNLQSAIDALRIDQTTTTQMKTMSEDHHENVNAAKPYRRNRQQKSDRSYNPEGKKKMKKERSDHKYEKKKKKDGSSKMKDCRSCGGNHPKVKHLCPAFGKKCGNCGKQNHFMKMCWKEKLNQVEDEDGQESYDSSSDEAFLVEPLGAVSPDIKKIYVDLQFKDSEVKCQVDTGTYSDIMPYSMLCEIDQTMNPKMEKSKTRLKLYDNSLMPVKGERDLKCNHNGKEWKLRFKIVDGDQPPLLSLATSLMMGLIQLGESLNKAEVQQLATEKPEAIIEEYKEVFQGLGSLPGKYHIEVDDTVRPVQHTPRRVPVPLKEQLRSKIEDLEKQGIIIKEDQPTEWISSMVTIKKPGKLRLCLDPRDLNKAIKRPKYQMPTLDEVLPNLANAKIFTVLDAKDGFHQVELDEASSKLTTFWTPFGRYRYLRMPFGISSAPEEWQRRLNEALIGLPGVICIADDILVYGAGDTEEEVMKDHNKNLRLLLQRAAEINLKLNRKKLKLCLTEVSYMGQLLTNEGIKPDPSKIAAITEMERPKDKKGVQSILGCVNYLSRYLPKLAEVSEPLRRLTEKDAVFTWQSQQEEAFNSVKQMLTQEPLLRYYDVTRPVSIQCDASEYGLGATLLQDNQPVAYASRSLSPAERNYAQIEKEALAIVFACEKFDQYIHGREEVTVESDHKPLIPIFKKPIHRAPKRLQRMLLRLQKYNLTLEFKPGVQMYIADWLSRMMMSQKPAYQIFAVQEDKIYQEIESINQLDYIRVTDTTGQQLQQETQKDPVLLTLKTMVLSGWPDDRNEVPVSIREYFGYRDEITVHNGIMYKGMNVIVPTTMQKQMLERIHASHLGLEACLRRAKDVLFWPGMAAQIADRVDQCSSCNAYLAKQQKEPMMSYEIPSRPWTIVSQDLFTYHREDYLVTVDHYSDFWEVDNVTGDTSAEAIIQCTKRHFARHGIPSKVISDNGGQFVAASYEQFAREWEFEHVTSSPHHSQSNGKAEATVKIVKKLIKKTKAEGKDIQLAILDWRNTPNETRSSPVQRLMSRRTRTLLPTPETLLKPQVVEGVAHDIKQRKKKAKKQYDKSSKELPELQIGETVRLQPEYPRQEWRPATCLQKVGPRSYLVQTRDGQKYRRNRKFLQQTKETEMHELRTPSPETRQDQSVKDNVQSYNKTQNNSSTKNHNTTSSKKQSPSKNYSNSSRKQHNNSKQQSNSETTGNDKPARAEPVKDKPATKSTRTREVRPPSRFKDFELN